jgi:mRNA interferase RelE/StbE
MLKDNPIAPQSAKLSGAEQLYRIRVGEYRIVFGIDKVQQQVVIHHVRHRRDVYRRL